MLVTPAFYYLDNFQLVLDSIENRYQDLMSPPEIQFIGAFKRLSQPSRALAVRMIMRKPRLFRWDHLQYAEIEALQDAMGPLLAAGWVCGDPTLSIDDLFSVFDKARLLELLRLPRSDSHLQKSALLDRYRPRFVHTMHMQAWCIDTAERIFRLEIAPLCERLRLLYFGDFDHTWSEFVLTDLGVRRFEKIEAPPTRPFASRAQWDAFVQIYRCREQLRGAKNPQSVLSQVPQFVAGCDWLESRRQRLLFRIGQALERADNPVVAWALYARCAHPGAAIRAIRIQEAGPDAVAALRDCEAALCSSANDQERLLLDRARHRLRRRLLLPASTSEYAPTSMAPTLDVILDEPPLRYSVEREVGRHLLRLDPTAKIYYVENSLMTGLFGLLCWKALFAPIEGAFFHRFHRAPADLSDASFFQRRRGLFAHALAELEDGRYRSTILGNFTAKHGIDNTFVAWSVLGADVLHDALECIPSAHLKPWFELMARDFQSNRCGFPDLIQFWPRERRYRLIEVKAPGDRLQDNQRRVLSRCVAFEISVLVCRVQWRDRSGC